MSFFKQIADLIKEAYTVQLIMQMKSGKMTVTLVPKFESKSDDITSKIQPLSITESPDELDRTFITVVSGSMVNTRNFADALKAYDQSLGKAKKTLESKDTSDKKEVKTETVKETEKEVKEDKQSSLPIDEVKASDQVVDTETGEIIPAGNEEKDDSGPPTAARLEDIAGEDISDPSENEPAEQEESSDQAEEETVANITDEEDESW